MNFRDHVININIINKEPANINFSQFNATFTEETLA